MKKIKAPKGIKDLIETTNFPIHRVVNDTKYVYLFADIDKMIETYKQSVVTIKWYALSLAIENITNSLNNKNKDEKFKAWAADYKDKLEKELNKLTENHAAEIERIYDN